MGLRYATVTGVARDDLPDGGAWLYAETVRQIHELLPGCGVELLIPDFNARARAARRGVRRPARGARAQRRDGAADLQADPARRSATSAPSTCSPRPARPAWSPSRNLILGLGEERAEVSQALRDLHDGRLRADHHHPVPAADPAPPPGRALGQAGGVRRAARGGRGDRLRRRDERPAGALVVPGRPALPAGARGPRAPRSPPPAEPHRAAAPRRAAHADDAPPACGCHDRAHDHRGTPGSRRNALPASPRAAGAAAAGVLDRAGRLSPGSGTASRCCSADAPRRTATRRTIGLAALHIARGSGLPGLLLRPALHGHAGGVPGRAAGRVRRADGARAARCPTCSCTRSSCSSCAPMTRRLYTAWFATFVVGDPRARRRTGSCKQPADRRRRLPGDQPRRRGARAADRATWRRPAAGAGSPASGRAGACSPG